MQPDMARLGWLFLATTAVALVACDEPAATEDAGPDGGSRDASVIDTGVMDAGRGGADAGLDAGTDAGPLDAGAPDAGPQINNYVFVTSSTTTGAIGGLAGADAICNSRATEAGLPGTYAAWLSTSTVDAIDRLAGARGWVRTDGRAFANGVVDLSRGRILHPIRFDENGVGIDGADATVWTGTQTTGRATPGSLCGDWTATAGEPANTGNATATILAWTRTTGRPCTDEHRLYCFGIDRVAPLVSPSDVGRVAFLSTAPLVLPSAGIAAADTICQTEAGAAGLPGTYLAALATVGTTIPSRFDLSGAPWVRTDGARIAATAAGLFTDEYIDAPPNLDASGVSYSPGLFWTGAGLLGTLNTPGTPESTCANWTSDSGVGRAGGANQVWRDALAGRGPSCSYAGGHVLCLQE